MRHCIRTIPQFTRQATDTPKDLWPAPHSLAGLLSRDPGLAGPLRVSPPILPHRVGGQFMHGTSKPRPAPCGPRIRPPATPRAHTGHLVPSPPRLRHRLTAFHNRVAPATPWIRSRSAIPHPDAVRRPPQSTGSIHRSWSSRPPTAASFPTRPEFTPRHAPGRSSSFRVASCSDLPPSEAG